MARAFYATDLAFVHNRGFGGLSRGAAPAILAAFRRAGFRGRGRGAPRSPGPGPRGATVVDLGCGSGIWLVALQRAGYKAVGIDRSAAMVRLARHAAPGARLIQGSVWTTPLPQCSAVTALGEVVSYLPAGSPTALFRRIARALEPGGMLVFDAVVTDGGPPMSYRLWNAAPDGSWYVLVNVAEDVARRRLRRDITTFRRERGLWRRLVERHELRVSETREIVAALRSAGFSVRVGRAYGRQRLPPRRAAFFARRR